MSSGDPSGARWMASVIATGAWLRLVMLLQKQHAVTVLAASMRPASATSSVALKPGNRCAKAADIWRRYPPWASPMRCSTGHCCIEPEGDGDAYQVEGSP